MKFQTRTPCKKKYASSHAALSNIDLNAKKGSKIKILTLCDKSIKYLMRVMKCQHRDNVMK